MKMAYTSELPVCCFILGSKHLFLCLFFVTKTFVRSIERQNRTGGYKCPIFDISMGLVEPNVADSIQTF